MPIRSQFDTEAEWLEHVRMYFAGQALAGELASQSHESTWRLSAAEILASRCYQFADAMLAERARPHVPPSSTPAESET